MTQYEELKNIIVSQIKKIEELEKKVEKVTPVCYDNVDDCPSWAKPYVQKAIELGYIHGDEHGKLGLTETKIHTLVVELRAEGVME